MSPVSSTSLGKRPSSREGKHNTSSSRQGTIDRSSGLVARVKYGNNLPDIPFDPKFLKYPFDANRFVQYQPTSLEKLHKTELHTDPGLGVFIDLINPDTYKVNPNDRLDPADEELLQEDVPVPANSLRSSRHKLNVSWLRRSEYISQEFNRYGVKSSNIETRIGASVKDMLKEEDIYKDREGQLAAIEKTFEDAKQPIIKHHSKPGVTATEVLPIYPDFKMWMHPSAQVIFDTDPALQGKTGTDQMEEMSQAMIRGMVDEEGDQFVAYFLPTSDTRKKRKRDTEEGMEYDPEETYDYKLAREYNWNVKNKASKGYEENYFFVFRENGVHYNELETRVRLSKRRAKGGGGVQAATNAVLAVKHRDLNDQELQAQEIRKMQLEAMEIEEEEDDGEVEDEEQNENNEEENDGEEKTEEQEEENKSEDEEEATTPQHGDADDSEDEQMMTSRKQHEDDDDDEEVTSQKEGDDDVSEAGSSSSSSGDEDEGGREKIAEGDVEVKNEIFGSASDISDDD